MIFGLAHVHHFYEFRVTHPHVPAWGAVLRSLLQLAYTTLFGGYVTFLYLRSGSLLAVVLVHAFCNRMGFPRFWGRVSAGPSVIGPDYGDEARERARRRDGAWSVAYYVILAVGAVSWWRLLWPWTESGSALVRL